MNIFTDSTNRKAKVLRIDAQALTLLSSDVKKKELWKKAKEMCRRFGGAMEVFDTVEEGISMLPVRINDSKFNWMIQNTSYACLSQGHVEVSDRKQCFKNLEFPYDHQVYLKMRAVWHDRNKMLS